MNFNKGSHTLILGTGRVTEFQFVLKAGYVFADLYSVILVRFVPHPKKQKTDFAKLTVFFSFFVVAEKAVKLQSCH